MLDIHIIFHMDLLKINMVMHIIHTLSTDYVNNYYNNPHV